jgi:hypothetical protein
MHLVPFAGAPAYEAPGHYDMTMRRLQGREAGPSDTVWIGVSVIEAGGGTTASASLSEKFYVVIEGAVEITASLDGRKTTAVLRPLDSCRIAPGETRELHNPGRQPAKVLLVMAL